MVEQLKITLLGEAPTAAETDPEAYALYLQARHLANQGTAESYEQSNALYQQALAIEPEYAAAWYGLARNYAAQANLACCPLTRVMPWHERRRSGRWRSIRTTPQPMPSLAGSRWTLTATWPWRSAL